jgi:uridine kinase
VEIVGTRTEITTGQTLLDLLRSNGGEEVWGDNPIALAHINGRRATLAEPLWGEEQIELVHLNDPEAHSTTVRSLCFVLAAAAEELFPEHPLWIEFSHGNSIYCELQRTEPLQKAEVNQLKDRMQAIIDRNLVLKPQLYGMRALLSLLDRKGRRTSYNTARYLPRDNITLYRMSGTDHLFYGLHLPSTGYIKAFDLIAQPPGFFLLPCAPGRPAELTEFELQPKLLAVMREYASWLETINALDIGGLNHYIVEGRTSELIQACEARHEQVIVKAAELVSQLPESGRLVLVAGPTCSGKTSFAKRLMLQLKVLGFHPFALSLDNYFVDREQTPRDADGDYDYESLRALKVDLFNEHLQALMTGQAIRLPRYDFHSGISSISDDPFSLAVGEPLIVEGIHGLNPALTPAIATSNKLHVYVSALSHMNIDNYSYIPTTLTRLYRRIVRDAQFRGYPAAETLRRWPKVREGEAKHVFVFQQNADVFFNSGLAYELGVLKLWAEPRLAAVSPTDPNYGRARTLIELLTMMLPIDARQVPPTSLLREFIGESGFHY